MDFIGAVFGIQLIIFVLCVLVKLYNVMSGCTFIKDKDGSFDIIKNFMIFIIGIVMFGVGLIIAMLASSEAVNEIDTIYANLFYGQSLGLVMFFLFFMIELIFYIRFKVGRGIRAYGTK